MSNGSNAHFNTLNKVPPAPNANATPNSKGVPIPIRSVVDHWNRERRGSSQSAHQRPTFPSLDYLSADHYLFPAEFSSRPYQRDIVRTALRFNTLVCLPTGTGKTLVASVLMYNFRRWYPSGKIIFMAPSRPLVLQQHRAFCNLMHVDPSKAVTILGGHSVNSPSMSRFTQWSDPTISFYFCTPQVLEVDIANGSVPTANIVCLCIDECHRSKGEYSYLNVVKTLFERDRFSTDQDRSSIPPGSDQPIKSGLRPFRIIGLSATPATTIREVKTLCYDLHFERIEYRDESDPILSAFIHSRNLEKYVIPAERFQSAKSELDRSLIDALNECLSSICQTISQFATGLRLPTPEEVPRMAKQTLMHAMNNVKSRHGKMSKDQQFLVFGYFGSAFRFMTARELLAPVSDSNKPDKKKFLEYFRAAILGDHRGWISGNDSSPEPKAHTQDFNTFKKTLSFQKLAALFSKAETNLSASGESEAQPLIPSSVSSRTFDNLLTEVKRQQFLHPKYSAVLEIVGLHFLRLKEKAEWTSEPAAEPTTNSTASPSIAEDFFALDIDEPSDENAKSNAPSFRFGSSLSSNVIIFVNSRATAQDLVTMLEQYVEIGIKPALFVGQRKSNRSTSSDGMTQAEQIETLEKFRLGVYNVIVATSIAEEGLDTGEVDLIISYDPTESPLRIIQRFGRTGRKRAGRCISILIEGRQEKEYELALRNQAALNESLKQSVVYDQSFNFSTEAAGSRGNWGLTFPVRPEYFMLPAQIELRERLVSFKPASDTSSLSQSQSPLILLQSSLSPSPESASLKRKLPSELTIEPTSFDIPFLGSDDGPSSHSISNPPALSHPYLDAQLILVYRQRVPQRPVMMVPEALNKSFFDDGDDSNQTSGTKQSFFDEKDDFDLMDLFK